MLDMKKLLDTCRTIGGAGLAGNREDPVFSLGPGRISAGRRAFPHAGPGALGAIHGSLLYSSIIYIY